MMNLIGEKVRSFYNASPFPDYDLERFHSPEDLRGIAYPFAHVLDRSIPENASVIDVGTGTGQLAAFLSLRRSCVWGIDFSDASLQKAQALKKKLHLDSLHFKKVDIMDQNQLTRLGRQFDYVLCFGVLHHTADPEKGFHHLVQLVKPRGYIALGLYNSFGRFFHHLQKRALQIFFSQNENVKQWLLKKQIGYLHDSNRTRGWWSDQYEHPHETSHTLGEVLRWFRKNNLVYLHTLPPLEQLLSVDITGFWYHSRASPAILQRFYHQLLWVWTTRNDGGYWITFGQKIYEDK